MTAEQQLRERVGLWVEVDGTNRLVETSMRAIADAVPAVGRLLDPPPYKPPNRKGIRHHNDCLHDLPGVTICDCDQGDVEAYRAWLIGGDK